MRAFFIGKCMNFIKKEHPEYTEIDLEKIEYGLAGVYLLIPKVIAILIAAQLFGLLSEVLIFMIIHMFMKMHTFGLHARKSWICFVVSLVVFITVPWLAKTAEVNFIIKCVIGIIAILLIYKNSPADTYKKPIIDRNRRRTHKLLATLTATMYVILSICIDNLFLANSFFLSLLLQVLMTSPVTYTMLKLPYDNHLKYSN